MFFNKFCPLMLLLPACFDFRLFILLHCSTQFTLHTKNLRKLFPALFAYDRDGGICMCESKGWYMMWL